jgi:cytochrome c-type biogenesis protein CcmH
MRALLAVVFLMLATVAHAVEPSEMLKDPKLEARARAISQGLRCLVCQNENIDDSNASLAHDLRVLLRERLKAGDTDQQAIQYIVDRYGEFVLLQPTTKGANILLWIAGPVMAALGLGIAFVTIRARRRTPEPPLTDDEARRVEELMRS